MRNFGGSARAVRNRSLPFHKGRRDLVDSLPLAQSLCAARTERKHAVQTRYGEVCIWGSTMPSVGVVYPLTFRPLLSHGALPEWPVSDCAHITTFKNAEGA